MYIKMHSTTKHYYNWLNITVISNILQNKITMCHKLNVQRIITLCISNFTQVQKDHLITEAIHEAFKMYKTSSCDQSFIVFI